MKDYTEAIEWLKIRESDLTYAINANYPNKEGAKNKRLQVQDAIKKLKESK